MLNEQGACRNFELVSLFSHKTGGSHLKILGLVWDDERHDEEDVECAVLKNEQSLVSNQLSLYPNDIHVPIDQSIPKTQSFGENIVQMDHSDRYEGILMMFEHNSPLRQQNLRYRRYWRPLLGTALAGNLRPGLALFAQPSPQIEFTQFVYNSVTIKKIEHIYN